MALPTVGIEAVVDVLLKTGKVDDSYLLHAIGDHLKRIGVPPILIDTQFAHDGKPLTKKQALDSVTKAGNAISREIDSLNKEIAGSTNARQNNERKKLKETLVAYQNYVNELRSMFSSVDLSKRAGSKQTQQVLTDLLTGSTDLGKLTKDQALAAREAAKNMALQAAAMQKVVRAAGNLKGKTVALQGFSGGKDLSKLRELAPATFAPLVETQLDQLRDTAASIFRALDPKQYVRQQSKERAAAIKEEAARAQETRREVEQIEKEGAEKAKKDRDAAFAEIDRRNEARRKEDLKAAQADVGSALKEKQRQIEEAFRQQEAFRAAGDREEAKQRQAADQVRQREYQRAEDAATQKAIARQKRRYEKSRIDALDRLQRDIDTINKVSSKGATALKSREILAKPDELKAIYNEVAAGANKAIQATEALRKKQVALGEQIKKGASQDSSYYGQLTRQLRTMERLTGNLVAQREQLRERYRGALDSADKIAQGVDPTVIMERELAYGARRFAEAGGLAGRDRTIFSAAKRDLPYIIRHLEVMEAKAREAASALLVSGRGDSNAFRQQADRVIQYSQSLKAANDRLKGHNSLLGQTNALLRQFVRYGIGYAALYRVLSGATALIRNVVSLEAELKNIQAITGATADNMQTVEAAVKRTATVTKFTTNEIAEAARILAQAGVTPDKLPATLGAVAQFATATGSSIEVASDLLTTMRTVFKEMEDSTLANQLTRALNISKLNANDLKTILSLSAQMAENYRLTSDQYLAAVSTLRDAGLKASTVATGLRQGLIEIFAPDSKTIKIISQRYAQLGEKISENAIRSKFFAFTQEDNPLIAALRELRRLGFAGSGASVFQRTFDVRAENAIKALISNFEDLERAESKITFGNAAADAATTQMESLSNSIKNLGAAISVLAYDMSSDLLPQIEDVVDAITDAVLKLDELNIQLAVAGKSGIGSHLGVGLVGAATAASTTPGSVYAKAGAGIVGFTAASGGSFAAQQVAGESRFAGVIEWLVGLVAAIVSLKTYRGLKGMFKGGSADKIGDALGSVAFGFIGLRRSVSEWLAKFTSFRGAVSALGGMFGKLLTGARALFGPVGVAITALTLAYELFSAFTKDEEAERKKAVKAAKAQAKRAKQEQVEAQNEIGNYRLSKPGRPALKGSVAAKFEDTKKKLTDLDTEIRGQFGVGADEARKLFDLLLSLDREFADREAVGREAVMRQVEALTKTKFEPGSTNAQILDRMSAEAGRVQGEFEGFTEALSAEVARLRGSDQELTPVQNAMVEAYDKLVDKHDLYEVMSGNAEVIATKMAEFFQEFYSALEKMKEVATYLGEKANKANLASDLALEAVKSDIANSRNIGEARTVARLDADTLKSQPYGQQKLDLIGRIASTRAAINNITPGFFGFTQAQLATIENLEAGLSEYQSRFNFLVRSIEEKNKSIETSVEQYLVAFEELMMSEDERVARHLDFTKNTPGGLAFQRVRGRRGQNLTTVVDGVLSMTEDMAQAVDFYNQTVTKFPEPLPPSDAFLANLSDEGIVKRGEIEIQALKEAKRYTDAAAKLKEVNDARERLIEAELVHIREQLKDMQGTDKDQENLKKQQDLVIEKEANAAKLKADLAALENDRLQAAKKSLEAQIESMAKAAKEGAKTGSYNYPRAGRAYRGTIESAAAAYGINPSLLAAVIQAESSFNPRANSGKAAGIAQFTRATGARYGLTPEERYDPSKAIYAAANYLADLLRMFGGNTVKAIAAYNAGEGAVQKYGGVPPYKETQNYVARVGGLFSGAGLSAEAESTYQMALGKLVSVIEQQVANGQLTVEEGQAEIEALRARGRTLGDLAEIDKQVVKAQKEMLTFIEAVTRADRVTAGTDLKREVLRRSQEVRAAPEKRLEEIAARAQASEAALQQLFATQANLVAKLQSDQFKNDAAVMGELADVEDMIQTTVDSLAELRQDAIAASLDVSQALIDAFDISALADGMRQIAEDDIRELAGDIRETLTGAFKSAGEEIADSLFNPEAEGKISDRLDKLFQRMFQDIASQIFTAYFNKLMAGAFSRLEGLMGGGASQPAVGTAGGVAGLLGGAGGLLPGPTGAPRVWVDNMGTLGGASPAGAAGAIGDLAAGVNTDPVQKAVNATAEATKQAGVGAAKQSKGVFQSLFEGIGGFFKSALGGLKSILGGLGSGFLGVGKSILGAFGFARGGMIRGIPGIDKVRGFAMGSRGAVEPIAVTSGESILNRKATAVLGEGAIDSLNANPVRFLRGPSSVNRASIAVRRQSAVLPSEQGLQLSQATLQALTGLESTVRSRGAGTTRIEVPAGVLDITMRSYLERYFDDVIAAR